MRDQDSAFHKDSGKPPLGLFQKRAVIAGAYVMGYGIRKYGRWNYLEHADEWEHGQLLDSAERHLAAHAMGEDVDSESGEPHLAHALCDIAMLIELRAISKGIDDRMPRFIMPAMQRVRKKSCDSATQPDPTVQKMDRGA